MNFILFNSGLLLAFFSTISGCFDFGPNFLIPLPQDNLIENGSFEEHGLPSSRNWLGFKDTSRVTFATDVPSGGGKYSARIWSHWITAGTVSTAVPADGGYHIYRLSAFIKSSMPFQRALMDIYIQRDHKIVREKFLFISDTLWTQSSLLDTVATIPGDTLVVSFAGDYRQSGWGYTYVDLVSLVKVW